VRNTHPDALTPSPDLAYHSGGLYEVLIALIVFAIAWPLRKRLTCPLALMWLVIALFAVGRFVEFFARSDSPDLALGLEIAQWTSLALLAIAADPRRPGDCRRTSRSRSSFGALHLGPRSNSVTLDRARVADQEGAPSGVWGAKRS
jgi:hypothetical protein